MVSSGGAIYENLLNAKKLEDAKEELENWLICKYKERIASCRIQIDSYNSDIANLTPVV